jgi:hypothetical protein
MHKMINRIHTKVSRVFEYHILAFILLRQHACEASNYNYSSMPSPSPNYHPSQPGYAYNGQGAPHVHYENSLNRYGPGNSNLIGNENQYHMQSPSPALTETVNANNTSSQRTQYLQPVPSQFSSSPGYVIQSQQNSIAGVSGYTTMGPPAAPQLYPSPSHSHVTESPIPPPWVPYWSDSDQQWYYAETTGKRCLNPPESLPSLGPMPPYPGMVRD